MDAFTKMLSIFRTSNKNQFSKDEENRMQPKNNLFYFSVEKSSFLWSLLRFHVKNAKQQTKTFLSLLFRFQSLDASERRFSHFEFE